MDEINIMNSPADAEPSAPVEDKGLPVDTKRLQKFNEILEKYKSAKVSIDRRAIHAWEWWKLHNEAEEYKQGFNFNKEFVCKSGWLHNVIKTKHAYAMQSMPEPIILPRTPEDQEEAKRLQSIIPVILKENRFEDIYDKGWWDKLVTGTAIYMVTWDQAKQNGLGSVDIRTVDILNLYWQPGIEDIQDSKYVFHVSAVDNDTLEEMYPELKGHLGQSGLTVPDYLNDDFIDMSEKSYVVDVYYKKYEGQQKILHYCKYCNEVVLYSTENGDGMSGADALTEGAAQLPEQPDRIDSMTAAFLPEEIDVAPEPLETHSFYDDQNYPFVFDVLFPIKNSPSGYGFIDTCQNTQIQIDFMDTAFIRNFGQGVVPRYFINKGTGSINMDEMLDINNPFVTVEGQLGQDYLRPIDYKPIAGNYISVYQNKITELRETSGNTETAQGISTSGVTSAAGIAALQEASGISTQDTNRYSFRATEKITEMVIERIRQFMDMPRQFRITGEMGRTEFVNYSNENIKPQWQGGIGEVDLGYRLPCFDLDTKIQKKNTYTRQAQNDLMIQFYGMGFFNPQYASQAVACVQQMDFDGKDEFLQQISQNGNLFMQNQQMAQMLMQLTQAYEPQNLGMLQQMLMQMNPGTAGANPMTAEADKGEVFQGEGSGQNRILEKARARANAAGSTEA